MAAAIQLNNQMHERRPVRLNVLFFVPAAGGLFFLRYLAFALTGNARRSAAQDCSC